MLGRLSSFVSTPKESPSPSTVQPVEDPLASLSSSLLGALPATGRGPLPVPSQLEDLKSQLPIACGSCESCEEDEEDERAFPELPKKFDMDLETPMLGDIISECCLLYPSLGGIVWEGRLLVADGREERQRRKEGSSRAHTSDLPPSPLLLSPYASLAEP